MHIQELMDLKGRVAVVTGGYGIYGLPISEALAEAGAHVVIASRSFENCDRVARELRGRGLEASSAQYDQASEASILAMCDSVASKLGGIDVLVNNSVLRSMRRFEDPLESWRQSMEVNATGLFAIARACLEHLAASGRGAMINIGSIQGIKGPNFSNYEGSDMTTPPDYHFHKHGMVGLTKYLAAWAGPRGVRVNAISPGGFAMPDHPESFIANYCRHVYLRRMACHDDIKGAVVFLASDASAYVTGHNLVVDGGYTC